MAYYHSNDCIRLRNHTLPAGSIFRSGGRHWDCSPCGPLNNSEDDNSSLCRLFGARLHIDKPTTRGVLAYIALLVRGVKRPADACLKLVENLRGRDGVIADDANIGDGVNRGAFFARFSAPSRRPWFAE
jgi:hypothetical protein